VAQKLKAKSDELQPVLLNLRARIDATSAALHKANDVLGSANQAIKASSDEKARRDKAIAAAGPT